MCFDLEKKNNITRDNTEQPRYRQVFEENSFSFRYLILSVIKDCLTIIENFYLPI